MSLGTENGLSVADIAAVTDRNNCNNGGYGFGGGFGEMLIAMIMLFLFPMFFGGGMFGGGMWGGMGGWGNGGMMAAANGALTRADLCSEFNFNGLENAVRGVQQGLCDGFYAMQNSINGLGTTVMQGFHGVDNAICNLGYQTQQGFNATQIAMMQGFNAAQSQAADCCCKTQTNLMQLGNQVDRGFCDTNFNQQANTTAIIQNAHNDTDRVLAKLDAIEMSRKDETIAALRSQVEALNLAQSQANQNAYLVNTLRPCPVPSYQTCNPWAGSGYGGCGCGNNAAGCC